MTDQQLFEYIRCPVTRSPLQSADAEMIREINDQIEKGLIRNRLDRKVERPLDAGLLNSDHSLLYPVWDGIPTLIADEAISMQDRR
ncbi:MAG: Trm112 family protein [Pirellulaceae bacterium]